VRDVVPVVFVSISADEMIIMIMNVLSCLWTKVHEMLEQRRRPLVFSNALARLSMSCFVQQIFANKSRSRRKTEQM